MHKYSFCCVLIALEITSFNSSPDGYGLKDQQVMFTCQFSPVTHPQYTMIKWYRNGELLDTTDHDESYTIASFQSHHSGNYSCSVFVMVGEVVLAGVRSVEKTVKLAGKFCTHVLNYIKYFLFKYVAIFLVSMDVINLSFLVNMLLGDCG